MRRLHIPLPFLIVFLIVPALTVYVHSLRLPWGIGWDAAVLIASTESAEELYARGVQRLEEQRYREALAMLEAATQLEGDVDPRSLAFYRETARLRLAQVQGNGEAQRRAELALLQIAAEAMDDLGAQAVRELARVRSGQDAQFAPYLTSALSHWEGHADLSLAVTEYLKLYRAVLESTGTIQAPLLRMWENLVASGAPDEELLDLGAMILTGRSLSTNVGVSPRGRDISYRIQHNSGFNADALLRRVATDVLAREPEGWLKAAAHYQRGRIAEREGKFGEAVEEYRAALASEQAENANVVAEAEASLKRLTDPALRVNGTGLYRPGSEHQLQVQWQNLRGWKLMVRRVDPVDDVKLPSQRSNGWGLYRFYPPDAGELVLIREVEDQREVAARDGEGEPHEVRTEAVWLEALPKGLYSVTVDGDPAGDGSVPAARVMFQVTELGATVQAVGMQGDRTQAEFWAINLRTGDVLPELSLSVFHARRARDVLSWDTQTLRTDRDGLAQAMFNPRTLNHSLVVAEADGEPIVMLDTRPWGGDRVQGTDTVGFVLTDRPLYRPSEEVFLQAFVRDRDLPARSNHVPESRQVVLRVNSPDGSQVAREALVLDDNGSLEWSWKLGPSPALGRYHVLIYTADERRALTTGTFQVDEVRLPEFTVQVSLDDARRYVLGDDVEVDVAAEYLFGGPVAGSAEIVVRRTPHYVHYWPLLKCGWLRPDFGRPASPWMGSGEEVLRTTVALDSEGHATVVVPTEVRDGDHGTYSYQVEARVTDASRREESGSSTIRVSNQELFAFLNPVQHVVAPGHEAKVRLRVQDVMSRAVELSGTWKVMRTDDGDQVEVLERQTATDASGEVVLAFNPVDPGYYTVSFAATDSRGQPVVATTQVWCADPKTTRVVHGHGGLQLIAEKDEFLGDDVARVLLVSEIPGRAVHLSTATAAGVETQVVHMDGTVKLLEFELSAAHRPRFSVRAARANDFLLHTADAHVLVPLARHALDVALEFGESEVEPGASVPLRVSVTDALGGPVQAPVTLAVVDSAVLAILPRSLPDPASIFQNFWTPGLGSLQLSSHRFGGHRELKEEGDDLGALMPGEVRYDQRSSRAVGRAAGLRSEAMADALPAAMEVAKNAPAPPDGAAPTEVRTDFRTTALWRTAVMTDADGTALVDIPMPESLTEWEALGVAVTSDAKAGMGTATVKTRKDVMVRLNHPRVFREQDRFRLAATVHNESDEDLATRVDLTAWPLELDGRAKDIVVPAHGQVTVEWWGKVPAGSAAIEASRESGRLRLAPDEAWVEVIAETAVQSDAFRRKVKLLPHGTPQRVVASAEIRSGSGGLSLELPSDRLSNAEVSTLTLSPSVLAACVDALPYLAEYPYGCTEQTLSRFVPAVAVRAAIEAMGASSKRIDPELDAKVAKGLQRVLDFQQSDGGWGWWKEDQTSAYMTAYALIALTRAAESGVDVGSNPVRRGREALRGLLPKLEGNPDTMAYALYALSAADLMVHGRTQDDATMQRYAKELVDGRDDLRDYARALLATHLSRVQAVETAQLVLAHLENTAVEDDEYGSVHWGKRRGYWWRGDGAVETTAFALQAYQSIDPGHEYVAAAARWLLANREGSRWNSTRDTAHAIYALVDYARAAGELRAEYDIVARLNGQEVARLAVTPETIIDGGGEFAISPELLSDGRNSIDLELVGTGVCYATWSVDTWTAQEDPAPTKHYLGVERQVVRLTPTRTLGGAIRSVETPLEDGDRVLPGDRLRVKLTFTAHNNLEYIAVEDPRPAGCEPVDVLSGWVWDGGLGGRREVRDDRTAFFFSSMSQGTHSFSYELRAESPGTYHVMPTQAYAMYVPDVSGTSAEDRLNIFAE